MLPLDLATIHDRMAQTARHGINATALAQVGFPKVSISKKQATRKGVTKKKSAKLSKLCAEVDESSWQPRAALTTTGPHSSQSPPSQFPPQAQAQCSTPSSVQAFTSQQQMSPPAILSSLRICQALLHKHCRQTHVVLGSRWIHSRSLSYVVTLVVYFGCKQRYPHPIHHPGELCIIHREWRTFMLPGSPALQSQFGNAYYHLHLPCIWSVWPQFDPQRHLVIPNVIAVALLPVHKQALAASFRVFLD